jgi:hypothetical protein
MMNMKNLFGYNLQLGATSPKVGGKAPPDPPKLKLTQLKGQIFNFEGQRIGEEFSIELENMDWDLENESDYLINSSLDLFINEVSGTPLSSSCE